MTARRGWTGRIRAKRHNERRRVRNRYRRPKPQWHIDSKKYAGPMDMNVIGMIRKVMVLTDFRPTRDTVTEINWMSEHNIREYNKIIGAT